MGKFEKGIVLAVLFLVAVILGVSLNSADGVAHASSSSSPLAQAQAPADSGPSAARSRDRAQRGNLPQAPAHRAGTGRKRGPGALETTPDPALRGGSTQRAANRDGANRGDPRALSTNVAPQPELREVSDPVQSPSVSVTSQAISQAREPAPVPQEAPAARSLEGLEATLVDGLMLYTWREGDSFASVASKYLGAGQTSTLRKANEGRTEASLRPGHQIYMPTDLEPVGSASVYVVVAGDVLGTISSKVYGTSKKWNQIYDANRDVLDSPNSLKVGQKLRIPAAE